ncbi:hypothetical protein CVT25_003943, partial [Psilocybe cyanescens]
MLPHLIDAFLKFQWQGAPARDAGDWDRDGWTMEVISLEGHFKLLFRDISTDTLTGRGARSFFQTSAVSSAVTLVEFGIISTSPKQPKLGFSIETLRFYRQLRCVSPRFSLDAFAKALNHYHAVPHRPYLADQLSNTYDCYLKIIRAVDRIVANELGRNQTWERQNVCPLPYLADQLSNTYDCYLEIIRAVDRIVANELGRNQTWERQNVCPPCLYEVENETKLKFRLLAAMDGNNSLKLIDSAFRAGSVHTDTRSSTSGRWILPDEVDIFKDEVK